MRASELLGLDVVDRNGREVGHVFDIETESFRSTWRIVRLVVGSAGFVFRLGFENRDMKGPIGLPAIGRRLTGYRVNWEDIAEIEGRIKLKASIGELTPLREG
jgi:sporulation protein YlmC with PRC-barrel domain